METLSLAFVGFAGLFLLVIAGFAFSMWLYIRRAFATGRFRRIRRVRAHPDGPVIEEVIEEEVPVEDQS
ncbi:MAG TPA: hypothetical protein VKV19_15960 [Ktedonobacteraceae bacterium]|nr:hypothetical protein [Ktedonobacteraceae bacterium]